MSLQLEMQQKLKIHLELELPGARIMMRVLVVIPAKIGILEGVMQISAAMICLCGGSVIKEISNLVQEIGNREGKAARLIRDDGDKKKKIEGWERSVEQINNVGM